MLAQASGEASRDGLLDPTQAGPGYAIDYASFQRPAGGSSNGRTADSDSAGLGSNPSPPATQSILRRYLSRPSQIPPYSAGAATRSGGGEGGLLPNVAPARPVFSVWHFRTRAF